MPARRKKTEEINEIDRALQAELAWLEKVDDDEQADFDLDTEEFDPLKENTEEDDLID